MNICCTTAVKHSLEEPPGIQEGRAKQVGLQDWKRREQETGDQRLCRKVGCFVVLPPQALNTIKYSKRIRADQTMNISQLLSVNRTHSDKA